MIKQDEPSMSESESGSQSASALEILLIRRILELWSIYPR